MRGLNSMPVSPGFRSGARERALTFTLGCRERWFGRWSGWRRTEFLVKPGFDWPQRPEPAVKRRVNQTQPDDREKPRQASFAPGDLRTDLVRPFGRHFQNPEPGALQRVQQVNVKRHVGRAER